MIKGGGSPSQLPKLRPGENLLIQKKVLLKKLRGTLSLSNQRLFFCVDTGKDKLELPINQVKEHLCSKPGTPHALLKIVTLDEKTLVFVFLGEQKYVDRDQVTEKLVQLVGELQGKLSLTTTSNKRKEPEAIIIESNVQAKSIQPLPVLSLTSPEPQPLGDMEKIMLLQSDNGLRESYIQLVESGVVTANEFWATRQSMLQKEKQNMVNSTQKVGIPSTFLGTPGIQFNESDNQIHFKLNSDNIRQIFIKYPKIAKEYKEKVPLQVTEQEFWKEVLKADYIRNLLLSPRIKQEAHVSKKRKVSVSEKEQQMEQEAQREDPKELQQKLKFIDPSVNLTTDEGTEQEEEIIEHSVRSKNKQHDKTQLLIREFNRHSALVLESFIGLPTDKSHTKDSLPKRPISMTINQRATFHDLEEEKPKEHRTLDLDTSLIHSQRGKEIAISQEEADKCVDSFRQELENWRPDLRRIFKHSLTLK